MPDRTARHPVARTIANDHGSRLTRIILASALALVVFACGGGGGGQLAGGGIGGTGSALGPVSAKGSLTVNGVRFDTDNAAIFVEGQRQPVLGDTSTIAEGMAVLIRGVYDSASAGRASEVVYLRNLLGPVGAINTVDSSFTALGHTVTIDNDPALGTRMPGLANRLADLQAGDLVEVSGSADGRGIVAATFVRRVGTFVNGTTEVEIKGPASNLDIAATTFVIGGLTLDYDANGGTQLRNLTLGDLGANPFVAVKGTTFDANGRLIATSIERIDRALNPGANRRLEMQGIVVGCTNTCNTFSIDGQRVVLSANTVFRNGAANDLINDRKLEVEGTINAAGELLAQQISFVKGSVKIEALTDAPADAIAQSIPVLGIDVKVNGLTELKDGITLGGVGAAQALKIQGYRIGTQAIIATRIERLSGGSGKTRLEGPLQTASKAGAALTILGVPIAIGQQASFADHSRVPATSISFDTFFDTTVTGAIVSVNGSEGPDNQLVADEIQIESQP